MSPTIEPAGTPNDDRVDALRQQLRTLGYLDAGVDRFVLAPAQGTRRPWAIAALAALRIGLIAAALLGPAAALGTAVRLPGLITGARDAAIVALYFAVLFGLAATLASFVASMLVALLPVRGLPHRARMVSRTAGTLVGAASLIYLTFWWQIATPEAGAFSLGWTLFALAIAASISLLLGHVTAITAFALLVVRGGGATVAGPGRSAAGLTAAAGVAAFLGACVLLLLITPETDRGAEPPALAVRSPGFRVTVFAIDGFDPAVLDRLRAEGRVPTFERLAASGAIQLAADGVRDPARAWMTMATGQPPEIHGVHGLETRRVAGLQGSVTTVTAGLGQTLRNATDLLRLTRPAIASGAELRSKTFWEVAADAGLRAAVVNWWATWPADAEGANAPIVISDRATLRLERGGDPQGEIAPREVHSQLARDWPEIESEVAETLTALLPPADDPEAGAVLRRAAEIDALQLAMVKRLQTDSLDLLAIYLPGLDIVQHTLLGSGSAAAPSALSARLESVRSYYVYLDALLRDATAPDPRELVMIVTHPGRVEGGSYGLLMAEGEVFSNRVSGAGHAVDLASTVLYALGVPASRELAGAPLVGLFDTAFVQRFPVREVDSYGQRRAPSLEGRPMDQEMIERLRSLGYVR